MLTSENTDGSTTGFEGADDSTLNVQDPDPGDNFETLPAPAEDTGGTEWYLDSISLDQTIWEEFTGKGVHVGIYDSGVDMWHPDLWDNYDPKLEIKIDGVTYSGAPNDASTEKQ